MPLKKPLCLGFSPCPNDTYIFHALVHGRVPIGDRTLDVQLHDVETLNRMAAEDIFDITKLSAFAWLKHQARYRLLDSGAALGFGCGPLVVARPGLNLRQRSNWRVVLPGEDTTAHLLFRLWAPQVHERRFAAYDRILERLLQGQADLGVIIHENRFTYEQHGCERVVDLGTWWEQQTGLPIPLGIIATHSRVAADTHKILEAAIRESIRYARQNPDEAIAYIREHAQEMAEDVIRKHIATYVNEFSVDLGEEGHRALRRLEAMARHKGLLT